MNDIITNWIESLTDTDTRNMARGALDHLGTSGNGPTMFYLAEVAIGAILDDLGSVGGIDGPQDLERAVEECYAPRATVEECEALVSELWNYDYRSDIGGMGLHEVTDTFEADIEIAARSVVQAHAEGIDWDEEEDED